MKEKIKSNIFVVWARLMLQYLQQSTTMARNIGTSRQQRDMVKYRAALRIKVHSLEKGMSIGKGRAGFGQPKALAILDELKRYEKIAGVDEFVKESVTILRSYLAYNEALGADMSKVSSKLQAFIDSVGVINDTADGGIKQISKDDVIKATKSPFDVFSQWRYSVRDFGDTPVDNKLVERAFELCERTPSACNRQSWRIHVYNEEPLKTTLLKLQGGNTGFTDGIQYAILVCADLRCYGFYETNLPYVDGALYAMNLLYALTQQGLATIPLTMGIKASQVEQIKTRLGIPDHETPVLLIGVGTFKDNFKVAKSCRAPYTEYVKYNQ